MRKRAGQVAVSGSSSTPQPAAHICLEDLPSEAFKLIAQHASSPSTPAACLLPLVCHGWSTAADSVPLLVDVTVDLGPGLLPEPNVDVDAASGAHTTRSDGPAAAPAALLRARQLAAWLAKRRGSVRSLCIPGGTEERRRGRTMQTARRRQPPPVVSPFRPGWEEDLTQIIQALLPMQRAPRADATLPHLVHLELPALGLPDTAAFLEGLAACTGLQRLVLRPPYRRKKQLFSLEQMGAALAPLQQLQTLHVDWCYREAKGTCVAALLRQLPPSLEQVKMDTLRFEDTDSIPVTCITHLVRLRAWEVPFVTLVVGDVSSSSSGRGSGSGSGSSGHGAAGLTALTSLHCFRQLQGTDARLQAPNLRSLHLSGGAEPGAWEQLQGMAQLRQLALGPLGGEDPAPLGGMSQLQELRLVDLHSHSVKTLPGAQPWAAAVVHLTQLKALHLPEVVVAAGGPSLLTPLTQLEVLTVSFCWAQLSSDLYPVKARGWKRTSVGAVVQVVVAAAEGGWGPLQRLVLKVPSVGYEEGLQRALAAAAEGLPGVEVEVSP